MDRGSFQCSKSLNAAYFVKKVLYPRVTKITTVSAVQPRIASMMPIWYLMAVRGKVPERICPVIIPGRETMPMVSILFMVGRMALSKASLTTPRAAAAGVRILAYDCAVTPDSLALRAPVEVRL